MELTQLVMDSKRQWFSEEILVEVLHMTAVNLFRALPPIQENYDPYEFLDSPLVNSGSSHVNALLLEKMAKLDVLCEFGQSLLTNLTEFRFPST